MLLPSVTWTQEPGKKTLRYSLLTSRMDLVHHPSVDAGEYIKHMKSTEGHKTPLVGGKVEEQWSGRMFSGFSASAKCDKDTHTLF